MPCVGPYECPTLSPGWQASLKALLKAAEDGRSTGNAGLSPVQPTPLSWRGIPPAESNRLQAGERGRSIVRFGAPRRLTCALRGSGAAHRYKTASKTKLASHHSNLFAVWLANWWDLSSRR